MKMVKKVLSVAMLTLAITAFISCKSDDNNGGNTSETEISDEKDNNGEKSDENNTSGTEKPNGNNDNGNSEGNNTSGAEVSSNGVDFAGKAYYIGDRSIVAAPEEIQKLEFSNDGKVSILVFDHYDETVGDKTWGMVYKPIATAEYSQPAKKDKITIKWNEKTSVTYNLQKPSMTTSYYKQPKVGLIEIEPEDESEIFMRLNLGSWLYGEYDEDLSYSAKIEINDKDNPNFKNFLKNEYSGSLSLYYDTTDGEIVGGKYNAIKSVDTENRKIIFEKTDDWGKNIRNKRNFILIHKETFSRYKC